MVSLSMPKVEIALFHSCARRLEPGMPPTAATADDARDSEPLLSTSVDGEDVAPMSERTLGHSRVMFGSGGNSIRDRGTTTSAALWTSPPSRPPAGVSNSVSNSASITNHADAQPKQHLSIPDNSNQRRHRLALVWSYAPDWFVLFCPSSFVGVAHDCFMSESRLAIALYLSSSSLVTDVVFINRLLGFFV